VSWWWRELETPSFVGTGGMQNNDSHPSFCCISEHLFCFLCAAKFEQWKQQITKKEGEVNVAPGL